MSAIYFHSKTHGTAELRGAERAHMAMLQHQYGYSMNSNWSAVNPDSANEMLNACLAAGSATLTLLMRIHAQCESHCWVDGPNRAWMAGIIAKGRKDGLYRPQMGWEEVEVFLHQRSDEPVFLSFSGSEGFPSESCLGGMRIRLESEAAKWPFHHINAQESLEDEPIYIPGKWDDLTPEQQWSLHEQVLRQESKREDKDPDAPFSLELRPSNWNEYFFG